MGRSTLFGDVTAAGVGWLDLVLVVAGVLLIAWWDLIDQSSLGLQLGLGVLALGLAIPARDGLHALDRWWGRRRGAIDVD